MNLPAPATAHAPSAATAPSLAGWLAWAQARHAEAPDEVAAGLQDRAQALPADDLGAEVLRLAEHLWLGHLADPAGLAAWLTRLPAGGGPLPTSAASASPPLDANPAMAQALARIHWALATLAGQPAPALDIAARWRALQNVVLALAQQGQGAQAQRLLLADEQLAAAQGANDAGRAYAACANNVAAHLCEGAGSGADRDRLMLAAAALSLRAWSHAGSWLQQLRAEYRLALCHAALGQGDAALLHARRCLQGCQAGDGAQPGEALEHYFAHEALARAHHAAGDRSGRQAAAAQMQQLLPAIDEAEGLRAACAQALRNLPGA